MIEKKKRSRRQWEAYIELNVNKIPHDEIVREMRNDGYSDLDINQIINKKKKRFLSINFGLLFGGIIVAILGILVSVDSYERASSSYYGGTYFIFWGLVLVGVTLFFTGLVRLLKKK